MKYRCEFIEFARILPTHCFIYWFCKFAPWAIVAIHAATSLCYGSNEQAQTPPRVSATAADPELTKTLETVCRETGKMSSMTRTFSYHRQRLCRGDKPTDMLTQTFINRALTSSAALSPQIEEQRIYLEREKISSRFYGASVRINISAKKFYQNASRIFADTSRAKSLLAGLNSLVPISRHEDKQVTFHDQGLYGRYLFEYQFANVNRLAVEYEGRLDSWVLEKNRVYLLTSYLVKTLKNIFDSKVMYLVIQGSNSAYVVILSENAVHNFGAPEMADKLFNDYFIKMIECIKDWAS